MNDFSNCNSCGCPTLNNNCSVCGLKLSDSEYGKFNIDFSIHEGTGGLLLCKSCFDEISYNLKLINDTSLDELPLFIHHTNPFVRELINKRLEKGYEATN